MRRKTVSLCAAVAAALSTSHAFAADTDFFWLPSPATTDIATASNYSSTPNSSNGDVYTLANASLSFPNPTTPFNPGKLRIGHLYGPNPGPATLTMTGGSITPGGSNSVQAFTGDKAGLVVGFNTNGTLTMSGTSSMTVTEYVVVGHDASLDAVSGTGTGVVTLNDSAVLRSTNNDFVVGNGNRGEVTLNNNSTLSVLPTNLSSTRNNDLNVGASVLSLFTMNDNATVTVCNSVQVGSGSTFTMNGGTLTTRAKDATHGFSTFAGSGNLTIGPSVSTNPILNPGDGSKFIMNAGTLNVGNQLTVGQSGSTNALFTIVSGTLATETAVVPTPAPVPAPTVAGNITVGSGTSSGATMNIQGGTVVNNHRFLVGGGTSTGSVVNQSAGTVTVDLSIRVSDTTTASATYNLSGGSLSTGTELSFVGRQGTGIMNHSLTGIASFNGGLAIGDDAAAANPATGVYQISGGELHATLLAGNALRIGTAGTGTLRVAGDDGLIDVNGNMLVSQSAKGVGTLAYQFEDGDLLSVVDVSGTATFNAGSALVADTSLAVPTQRAYDVLTAANVVDNGVVDSAGWTHRVINGGANGKLLQIAQLGTFYWDTDGANPGAGGATPTGTWDAGTSNLSADSTGSSATTPLSTAFGDDVIFAAGTDGTGSYTVTVSGTQTARSVSVARGDVTLTDGTLAVGTFDVATGASGTVASTVAGDGLGSVTKTGPGTLTLTAANTYTGGTNVQAGLLQVARLHENNAVNITGGTLRVVESAPDLASGLPSGNNASVSRPSTLTIAPGATLDLANNDLIIDYTDPGASPAAAIEALVASGYGPLGNWFGTGITSSVAQQDGNFALAVADNQLLNTAYTSFSGQSVDTTTVLVKFTWVDDIDLDGKVTTGDAITFGNNYSLGDPATRATGDMDYDGIFTTNDAIIFGNNYDTSLPSLPEPGTAGALGLAALSLASGRRRRGMA